MTTHEFDQTTVQVSKSRIDDAMQAVEQAMSGVISSEVDVLQDASHHILNAGGKRVRPRLTMLAYLAAGGTDLAYAAPPAGAVELMHTASVVHDDINDHGILRRGRPSVNAIWGRTFALLTGDFLFTSVYQLMAPYGELNVILADAASALVEGETLQAYAVKNNEFTGEMYNRIIALKTAALFQAAGEIGARLANADEAVIDALKQYGYNVGLAFQIVDDILDIVGDEEKLGKTAGIDLEQGRGFAAVQQNGKHNGKGESNHKQVSPMDIVKQKLMAGNRLEEARQRARMLIQMAINSLDVLPESPEKQELMTLAKLVINRDH